MELTPQPMPPPPMPARVRRVRRVYDGARIDAVPTGVLPRVRSNELPDGIAYTDSGCELHASCLRCPRARCIEDERLEGNVPRDRQIALLHQRRDVRVADIAAAFGLTRRQISRIVRKQGIVPRLGRPPGRGRTQRNQRGLKARATNATEAA
jgi:hypothetical protein